MTNMVSYHNTRKVDPLVFVCEFEDGLPYLFHTFRNKYFNKISLGNMLYFQNKFVKVLRKCMVFR